MTTDLRVPDATLLIEEAFAARVKADARFATMQVVAASNRATEVKTPYVFAWAESLDSRGRGYFVAQMQVVLVTNIDDTSDEERRELAGRLFSIFAGRQPFTSADGRVRVLGMDLPAPREASDGQEAGNSVAFVAGVQTPG